VGKERLRPRRSYSGVMIVSPLLFGGEGTLAYPPFLCFQWQNPSRRGECGEEWLGGPSWSPVGWSGDTLTIHRQAQFSRRLTTYHHKSPPDSLLVIL